MELVPYRRKYLEVLAVQVTEENIKDVAFWCDGVINFNKGTNKSYIQVKVLHPNNKKQTIASIGDWLLKSKWGFKIFPDSSFHSAFIKIRNDTENDCDSM